MGKLRRASNLPTVYYPHGMPYGGSTRATDCVASGRECVVKGRKAC